MPKVFDQIWDALTGSMIQRQRLGLQVVADPVFHRSGDRVQREQSAPILLCGDGCTDEGCQDWVAIQLPMQILSRVPQVAVQSVFGLDRRHQQVLREIKEIEQKFLMGQRLNLMDVELMSARAFRGI